MVTRRHPNRLHKQRHLGREQLTAPIQQQLVTDTGQLTRLVTRQHPNRLPSRLQGTGLFSTRTTVFGSVDADGTDPQQLTTSGSPHPPGHPTAPESPTQNNGIWVINSRRHRPTTTHRHPAATPQPGHPTAPESPTGSLGVGRGSGPVNADGTDPQQLTSHPAAHPPGHPTAPESPTRMIRYLGERTPTAPTHSNSPHPARRPPGHPTAPESPTTNGDTNSGS